MKFGQVVSMKSKSLISVIIPCFNGGFLLEKSLFSVLNQTWLKKEIILVNDGSTDKITLSIFEKFKTFSEVSIIDQSNHGLPHARNVGAKNARGEYLFFLDSDDWIEPETLENMFYLLKSKKEASYIFSDIFLEGNFSKIVKK